MCCSYRVGRVVSAFLCLVWAVLCVSVSRFCVSGALCQDFFVLRGLCCVSVFLCCVWAVLSVSVSLFCVGGAACQYFSVMRGLCCASAFPWFVWAVLRAKCCVSACLCAA